MTLRSISINMSNAYLGDSTSSLGQDSIHQMDTCVPDPNKSTHIIEISSDMEDIEIGKDIEMEAHDEVQIEGIENIAHDKMYQMDTDVPQLSVISPVPIKFNHASSADESFLSDNYQLQKEIIRLKLEMANLQSSLDKKQSLVVAISEDRYKLKRELKNQIAERDSYEEKYEALKRENKELRDGTITYVVENIEIKNERDELKRENERNEQIMHTLETSVKLKEDIISGLMENVEQTKKQKETTTKALKKVEDDQIITNSKFHSTNQQLTQSKLKIYDIEKEKENLIVECRNLASSQFQLEEAMKTLTKERDKFYEDSKRLCYENDRLNEELDLLRHSVEENGKDNVGLMRRIKSGTSSKIRIGLISVCPSRYGPN